MLEFVEWKYREVVYMKRNLLFVIILSLCLVTGCTKHYKTVQAYSDDMSALRQKLGDYTIEAIITTDDADINIKSYMKGSKWKTETSKNNGKTFQEGILYDGNEVYSYSKKDNIAMSIPFKQMMKKEGVNDETKLALVMRMINPTGILYYWDVLEATGSLDNLCSFGKITKKNNFPCRMILYKYGGEVCVSDKYGIAVYLKTQTPKQGNVEYNVKSINTSPISDFDLGLPAGIRKMSMSDLFQNLANMSR